MAKYERKTDEPKPEKKALFEKVAEDLIKKLEQGTAPWQKPWDESIGAPLLPYNQTTGKNYKGLNIFALMLEGREDPRWMTFNQAAENKWSVRKGEKGSLINFYKFDKQEAIRDEKGKPVLDEKGMHKFKTVKLEKPIITSAYVFNAEQIDGIPKLEKAEKPENNWQSIEAVENIINNSGAVVQNVQGNEAYYAPKADYIRLPLKEQFKEPGLYYATLLHEFGHWTGHESRLNRPLLNTFGTEDYAKEELRAEIASYMLGTDLKIGHDPSRHVSYVASWIKALKDDPFEIHKAAADAQKIYDMGKGFDKKIALNNTQDIRQENEPAINDSKLGLNDINAKSMKHDFNSDDLQSIPQQQKNTLDVGSKTQTSQSFIISKEDDFTVAVHLEKEDLKNINSIIDKLNDFKSEGFDFISVEKADYKYNTYTDAEYYYTESPNDVFYLAKDKKDIPDALNSFKLQENSEYNSEDNIKTGTSYTSTKIDDLIDLLQSKQIFLPREQFGVSLHPNEIKNFANLVNIAVDVNKIDVNKVVYRKELAAPGIPERLKIGEDEVTLTPQQRNDLDFGKINIGKVGKHQEDIYLYKDHHDITLIHARYDDPIKYAVLITKPETPDKTKYGQSKITTLTPGQDSASDKTIEVEKTTKNAGRKPNFGLNEVIKYKDSGFEVMALLKQGSLRMKDQSTEQVFILKPTDKLYGNLLKAKAQPLSESNTIKEPTKSETSTINSAFETKGAELESIQQIKSGFRR